MGVSRWSPERQRDIREFYYPDYSPSPEEWILAYEGIYDLKIMPPPPPRGKPYPRRYTPDPAISRELDRQIVSWRRSLVRSPASRGPAA